MSDNKKSTNEKWDIEGLKEYFNNIPKVPLRMKLRRLLSDWRRKESSHTIRGYRGNGGENIPRDRDTSSTNQFKENYQFNPEKTYIKKMEEEAYINSLGYTKDDLILTEKEYIQRMQEDAYLDSLPGYRKKDSKRDDER